MSISIWSIASWNQPQGRVTTKIGLISDIHACAEPLQEALAIFRKEKVAMVLCAGDVAGYGTELDRTVELLIQSECTAISGNHDDWFLDSLPEKTGNFVAEYLSRLPAMWEGVREGIHIYAVHRCPPQFMSKGIRLLDEDGSLILRERERWEDKLRGSPYDVLIVGHTHQVFAEQLGNTLVINPGSTKFNHTCAIMSLPDKEVRIFPLSGKEPLKSWNWGMMTGGSALSDNQ